MVRPSFFLLLAATFAVAGEPAGRYALILEDAPAAAAVMAGKDVPVRSARDQLRTVQAKQQTLRSALEQRGVRVTAAAQTLANVVFVQASERDAAGLAAMPGVRYVERLRPVKMRLAEALELIRASTAWADARIGGRDRAGEGVKIGIIDSGIDITHPMLSGAGYALPAGYPKGDTAWTNNKVIVARSYVRILAYPQDPQYSRPDDLSPRDRVGHGTAAAGVAAGNVVDSPLGGRISGVAPRAYLGNYKIFGSPGVNDYTFDDAILTALEDAFNDGMDVVTLSIGAPALWGPNDRGQTCGNSGTEPCDWRADAIENATRNRMAVVVAAGNAGNDAVPFTGGLDWVPAFGSVETPGTAPSAITVGSTTNRHELYNSVRVEGAPDNIRRIRALFGNGPRPGGPYSAKARDVARVGTDTFACTPLPAGSLEGTIALIERGGTCLRDVKVSNAQKAGAIGVIFYQWEGSNLVFRMMDLAETGIPAVLIGRDAGLALRTYINNNPDAQVTLDPGLTVEQTDDWDTIAYFSSIGPSIREAAIKPEVVAPATGLLVPTQKNDPNGDMFDQNGWTATQGSSFAVPMVAGAAALVKQKNGDWNGPRLKSAVVNTANRNVGDYDESNRRVDASVRAMGAGRLDAGEAVKAAFTAEPATISFGVLTTTPLPSRALILRNGSTGGAMGVQLRVEPRGSDPGVVRLSSTQVVLPAGGSEQISVRLDANSRPNPGAYEGFIIAEGGGSTLRIPYLYLVGDGVPYSIVPLEGSGFLKEANAKLYLTLKVLDRYGVPVRGVPVRFRSTLGGGRIVSAYETTDELGVVGTIEAYAGEQIGDAEFVAEVGNERVPVYLAGRVRAIPSINSRGVVNAGSNEQDRPVAPGSFISIYGVNMAEATRYVDRVPLPLSMSGVSVSFDVPASGISVPARMHFVSPNQINVQVPWELQGVSTAQMKVSIGDTSSALYTVRLSDHAPAAFEWDSSAGRIAAAQRAGISLITPANQAQRGEVVVLYANGLGPVINQPASGEVSPAAPNLATLRNLPEVTVGGRRADVSFAGLTPGSVGLYQINFTVPADAPTGMQPVVITANGVASKTTYLPIR